MSAFIAPALPLSVSRPRHSRWHASTNSATEPPSLRQPTPPPKYNDGPFARTMIYILRSQMHPYINWRSPKLGYAGFVEECRMLTARVGPSRQQAIIDSVLRSIFFPPHGPSVFRQHFSSPRLNASITPLFFSWLVGPSTTNTPEEGGYGVKIERCRFLEESGCKGLCVNMCQQPTQRFFTETLGLPLRMTPDYTDLSCQMAFGVHPLKKEEDPAMRSECFGECSMAQKRKQRDDVDDACFVR